MNIILCILFKCMCILYLLHIMYNSDVFVVGWVHGASLVCVYRVGVLGEGLLHQSFTCTCTNDNKVLTLPIYI